jgi:hypothetical protein
MAFMNFGCLAAERRFQRLAVAAFSQFGEQIEHAAPYDLLPTHAGELFHRATPHDVAELVVESKNAIATTLDQVLQKLPVAGSGGIERRWWRVV